MFLIITYKHPGIYKIAIDVTTGQALKFPTKSIAKKYAEQHFLGVFDIYKPKF